MQGIAPRLIFVYLRDHVVYSSPIQEDLLMDTQTHQDRDCYLDY